MSNPRSFFSLLGCGVGCEGGGEDRSTCEFLYRIRMSCNRLCSWLFSSARYLICCSARAAGGGGASQGMQKEKYIFKGLGGAEVLNFDSDKVLLMELNQTLTPEEAFALFKQSNNYLTNFIQICVNLIYNNIFYKLYT